MVIQKNDLKFSARLVHYFLCKEPGLASGSTGWIDRLVYRSIDPDGSDITVC
uniref:Uncharacterized protein n=1 Tax=Brassica oleracea TaxID=3712 RepID=A0A3P6EHR9_BRAOL|nr:unnamed protein product [Brassica oleracea]